MRRFPLETGSSTSIILKEQAPVPETKKRIVFDPERFRQPKDSGKQAPPYPYIHKDPEEDYYRRRFYPQLKETSDSDDELGLGGWRKRGGEGTYGRSFRESRRTRDEFIARYGVEALKPAMKKRPFWETQDAGDLDDEDYFDEKEYIYEPIKPRLRKDIPKTMQSLVRSLGKLSREGNHFLAAEVLDEGADCMEFDKGLWTSMHYACDRGHHAIVKLFLKNDPDIDTQDYDGNTPLMIAARAGQYEVCETLIQASADLEKHDQMNRTALLLALAARHHNVATLLIDSGAVVAVVDKDGWNAMHYACFYSLKQVVPVLFASKIDIHLQDFEGNTPLHWSTASGNYEICAMLIEHGADRRIKNHEGWTPAHTAVHWSQIRALMEVIKCREDLAIVNKSGDNLLDMARRLQHDRVAHVLDVFGASPDTPIDATSAETAIQPSVVSDLEVVTMHVRGRVFITTRSTLDRLYGSYFWIMLNPSSTVPADHYSNSNGLGQGPGDELTKLGEMEYSLDRDPEIFATILELLRANRYTNLKEVPMPEDKYELGRLLDEAKFFRLKKIVDGLQSHRRSTQAKSYRNAIKRRKGAEMDPRPAARPKVSEYGIPYLPPSLEFARGNDSYHQWDPVEDPFVKKVSHMSQVLQRRRKPR